MSLAFSNLAIKYLDWCLKHREPRTHEWYRGHIHSFISYLEKVGNGQIASTDLKPFHVVEWIDSYGDKWGDNYKGNAIVAIKRIYSWAEELGYSDINPIKKLKKPQSKRREIYMVQSDYDAILSRIDEDDPFRELFLFIWHTGCRPQEARHIEARHVDLANERIVFPAIESKGKRVKRIIYMQGVALEIIQRRFEAYPDGKLFRNTRGEAWTKYSICNRFHRLSKVIGKRLFAYAARHGFGTRKLIQGHDHLTVAALMGHTDGSMLAKIYSHISDDAVHLKGALAD